MDPGDRPPSPCFAPLRCTRTQGGNQPFGKATSGCRLVSPRQELGVEAIPQRFPHLSSERGTDCGILWITRSCEPGQSGHRGSPDTPAQCYPSVARPAHTKNQWRFLPGVPAFLGRGRQQTLAASLVSKVPFRVCRSVRGTSFRPNGELPQRKGSFEWTRDRKLAIGLIGWKASDAGDTQRQPGADTRETMLAVMLQSIR